MPCSGGFSRCVAEKATADERRYTLGIVPKDQAERWLERSGETDEDRGVE